MADITCDVQTLHQLRPTALTKKLSAVSPVLPYVETKARPNEFVLVARYGEQITVAEREWRFPSLVSSIHCRYMERWLWVDATQRSLRLRHAYFHLDHHRGPEEVPREILAFHWEPLPTGPGDAHNNRLRRPHLHITCAREPLGHAHFGTTLTVPPESQSDPEYLDRLLEEVFAMVEIEVLDRINSDPNNPW